MSLLSRAEKDAIVLAEVTSPEMRRCARGEAWLAGNAVAERYDTDNPAKFRSVVRRAIKMRAIDEKRKSGTHLRSHRGYSQKQRQTYQDPQKFWALEAACESMLDEFVNREENGNRRAIAKYAYSMAPEHIRGLLDQYMAFGTLRGYWTVALATHIAAGGKRSFFPPASNLPQWLAALRACLEGTMTWHELETISRLPQAPPPPSTPPRRAATPRRAAA
ncbi:MAG: hypothetical protein JSS51_07670 [Planctomycetes bacterium]|nr:hypothetical protein [Planctomycetota bacterium]